MRTESGQIYCHWNDMSLNSHRTVVIQGRLAERAARITSTRSERNNQVEGYEHGCVNG